MGKIDQGSELLDSLGPEMRDALAHPWRREILRVLHTSDRALTVGELAAALSPIPVARISYHVQALRRDGAVDGEGVSLAGGRHHAYRSSVASDATVLGVLREREALDRKRRHAARAHHSSLLLKVFRIPRPTRSIRLGARRNRPEPQS